ncbi:MAG: hypothetical protein L0027_16350 [Candidatus Rokubacteria bacterium]|nr:hypothetical protein [Candidatus Rokubacteria bacterium]
MQSGEVHRSPPKSGRLPALPIVVPLLALRLLALRLLAVALLVLVVHVFVVHVLVVLIVFIVIQGLARGETFARVVLFRPDRIADQLLCEPLVLDQFVLEPRGLHCCRVRGPRRRCRLLLIPASPSH